MIHLNKKCLAAGPEDESDRLSVRKSVLPPTIRRAPRPFEAQQSHTDAADDALASLVRGRLEQHPRFRGQLARVRVEALHGTIVLSGRLSSFYLKQLLQEAVKRLPSVTQIDNRVEVTVERPR